MQELIQWVLENLDYTVVLLFMIIESSFVPFPSEVIVPPAAWLAMTGDKMSLPLVIVVATVGAVIGALVNYWLARWLGRPVVYRFADSRLGHICLINRQKVMDAEDYFREHGAISTFIGRLVPAVRQLISIPAGLAKMKLSTFLLYTTLGAGIWNAILAAIGYYLQSVVPEEQLLSTVTEYSHELGYCFIAIGVLIVGFLIYKGRK